MRLKAAGHVVRLAIGQGRAAAEPVVRIGTQSKRRLRRKL